MSAEQSIVLFSLHCTQGRLGNLKGRVYLHLQVSSVPLSISVILFFTWKHKFKKKKPGSAFVYNTHFPPPPIVNPSLRVSERLFKPVSLWMRP